MSELFLSLAVFLLLHSVPAMPTFRSSLVGLIGLRTYYTSYSVVSLAVMVWVLEAALRSDYVELWQPAGWQALITIVTSPVALFLVLAGLISPNPFSVSLRVAHTPGAIVAITRHPVIWGFILWALGHVAINGDLRSLVLFGGLGLFSIAGLFVLDRRSKRRQGLDWQLVETHTSIIPFSALFAGRARPRVDAPMLAAFVIVCATTAWLLSGGHALMFGADPLAALAY